ncbi:thiamine biosynthesis lipoprotein [Algoriphagus ratkowskyi]|uniref:FAD:protein FMN transferase n=1 Tax=Algoriphagus ratkowskyi TaxID=57028 RepID=A0A2W7T5B6_9BACT|nr:FAD:protein FMN transferase [Algoriphagus ratkowskyi]PZX58372.1 thiamine biosynthesis lipoprotein [Algoriphagus ratkowskyi]TXD77760.1 FAD:protein FMN transferase [Algoriphagus ratkowskyi]
MRPNARKNIIYSIVLLVAIMLVYSWRNRDKTETTLTETTVAVAGKMTISGKTMGTTYNVTYLDEKSRDLQTSIDSLLVVFNQNLSTYIPDSELSRFNLGDTLNFNLPYLLPVLEASKKVYKNTNGAFDPTVGPLVNIWGFGPSGPELKDSVDIKNLLASVGFTKIEFDQKQLRKKVPGVYLDFSAIAKGYGSDVVANFLNSKGISDYLVEIGGELVAHGTNEKGELWKVGVNRPEESASAADLISIIALQDRGMATSGNYRNYYVRDSVKISHTINPSTGYPVNHTLLSATVLAKDCMTADAYATAIMVMGKDKAIALDSALDEIEVFLIYDDGMGGFKTFASESLKPYLSFPQEN